MTKIIDSGIASIKIEGRMKSPEYVYGVTKIYRKLLDENRDANKSEIDGLARLFSRGGFTDAYYTGEGSDLTDMLGIRSESDKAQTRKSEINFLNIKPALREEIILDRQKININNIYKLNKPENKINIINLGIFNSVEQSNNNNFFDIILLSPDKFDINYANGIALPPLIFDGEYNKIKLLLEKARESGAKHILIENPGQIELAQGFNSIGGSRLNIFNSYSAKYYSKYLNSLILSPELNLPQIRDIDFAHKGAVIYGRLPVMTFARQINIKNKLKVLQDEKSAGFPVINQGLRDILYNSVPIYMADKSDELDAAGIELRVFIFTIEDKKQVLKIINNYINKSAPEKNYNIKRIK